MADQPAYEISLDVEAASGKHVKVTINSTETLLEVRRFLQDLPDTCIYTAYHFEDSSNTVVPEFATLGDIPGFEFKAPESAADAPTKPMGGSVNKAISGAMYKLKMVSDFYDERKAREHVHQLRHILVNPPAHVKFDFVLMGENKKKLEAGNLSDKATHGRDGKRQFNNKTSSKADSGLKTTDFDLANQFDLAQYYDGEFFLTKAKKVAVLKCVKSIRYSAYNPVPGFRRLLGDLLYLEVETLEGNMLPVTCGADGFYLNQSTTTEFNAEPAVKSYKAQTLAAVLTGVSNKFAANFKKLIHGKRTHHPFETLPMPITHHHHKEWLKCEEPHTQDWNRSESANNNNFGMDSRGVVRDWNEEWQQFNVPFGSASPEDIQEDGLTPEVLERAKVGCYADFLRAAVQGAVAIVQGNIPPVNPHDKERTHVFMYNKIFFTRAIDVRNVMGIHGDEISYKNASHDLNGINTIRVKHLDGKISTVATVVVNFGGHRVVAQTIPTGMIDGNNSAQLNYGSTDLSEAGLDEVKSDPAFHELIRGVASKMQLKEHKVNNADGVEDVEIFTSLDCKGFTCSDGRSYLLDLFRTQPRDANFTDVETHSTALLRTELLSVFMETEARDAAAKVMNNFNTEVKARKAKETKSTPPAAADASAATDVENLDTAIMASDDPKTKAELQAAKVAAYKQDLSAKTSETQELLAERQALLQVENAKLTDRFKFNVDVFTQHENRLADSEETIAADKKLLVEASTFLRKQILPSYVALVKSMKVVVDDTEQLSASMHSQGINMRYLGELFNLATDEEVPYLRNLCMEEMLVRSAKSVLHDLLKNVRPTKLQQKDHWFLAPCISTFLTSFLGKNCAGIGLTKDSLAAADKVLDAAFVKAFEAKNEFENYGYQTTGKKKKTAKKNLIKTTDGKVAPTDPLKAVNVWQAIRKACKKKFGYDLAERMHVTEASRVTMLRSLCKKVGIQMKCRVYDFESVASTEVFEEEQHTAPLFNVSDVLDIFPVVKQLALRSQLGDQYFAHGVKFYQMRNPKNASIYFSMALGIYTRCFGPLHEHCAKVFHYLSMIAFDQGQFQEAVENQQRALIVYQRIKGLDQKETAHCHMNLALFLYTHDKPAVAIKHLQRVQFIYTLLGGPDHPCTASAHANLSTVLQTAGEYDASLKHVKKALYAMRRAVGDNLQVAALEHQTAIAHALTGNFRLAIVHERACKQITVAIRGAQNAQVQRATWFINMFAALAVQGAKGKVAQMKVPKAMESSIVSTWMAFDRYYSIKTHMTYTKLRDLMYDRSRLTAAVFNAGKVAADATPAVENKKETKSETTA